MLRSKGLLVLGSSSTLVPESRQASLPPLRREACSYFFRLCIDTPILFITIYTQSAHIIHTTATRSKLTGAVRVMRCSCPYGRVGATTAKVRAILSFFNYPLTQHTSLVMKTFLVEALSMKLKNTFSQVQQSDIRRRLLAFLGIALHGSTEHFANRI